MSVSLRPDDLVLVTGGSGFLGSAVARALIGRGSRVRALVSCSSPPDNLAGLGCEIVAGDLTDPESLKAAMRGVRYLLHVAADYRFWARDPSIILRVNVDGTRSLMQQALAAGVERIVYTSSVAALKVAGATSPVDETSPLAAHEAIGAYKRSKTLAERAVEAMILQDKLPAIIVNPTTPHRSARHQADTNRAHSSGCGARQDPGLRRHRAELRPRRRHRGGASACLRTWPGSANATSSASKTSCCRTCLLRSPVSAVGGRRASSCRACRCSPWRSARKQRRAG